MDSPEEAWAEFWRPFREREAKAVPCPITAERLTEMLTKCGIDPITSDYAEDFDDLLAWMEKLEDAPAIEELFSPDDFVGLKPAPVSDFSEAKVGDVGATFEIRYLELCQVEKEQRARAEKAEQLVATMNAECKKCSERRERLGENGELKAKVGEKEAFNAGTALALERDRSADLEKMLKKLSKVVLQRAQNFVDHGDILVLRKVAKDARALLAGEGEG